MKRGAAMPYLVLPVYDNGGGALQRVVTTKAGLACLQRSLAQSTSATGLS
jgi:hypothetical protein